MHMRVYLTAHSLHAPWHAGSWASHGLKLTLLQPPSGGDVDVDSPEGGAAAPLAGAAQLRTLPGVPPLPVALIVASRTLFWKPRERARAAGCVRVHGSRHARRCMQGACTH